VVADFLAAGAETDPSTGAAQNSPAAGSSTAATAADANAPRALSFATEFAAFAGTSADGSPSILPAFSSSSFADAPGSTAADKSTADSSAYPAATAPAFPGTAAATPALVAIPGADHNAPQSGAAAAESFSSRGALQQRTEDGPELSAGLQAWNGGQNAAAAGANASAHLAGNAQQSEMNVALRAEGMGAVQVHARVTGDQVGAAITVERHEAHAALASELPALHQALNERQLRLESVSVSQGSAHLGAGDGAARQQPQGSGSQHSAYTGQAAAPLAGAAETADLPDEPAQPNTAFDSQGRLSVQA
jgi:flagellar hook-length control protein FliK